jgi:hypothetical protein
MATSNSTMVQNVAFLLKRYGQTVIKFVGTVGVAALSIWYGAWFPDAQQSFKDKCNKIVGCKLEGTPRPSFREVTWHHATDFRTPVPYAFIALSFAALSIWNDVQDSDLKERLDAMSSTNTSIRAELANEKEEHIETRKEYNEAIEYILKYMFCTNSGEWYKPSCRVTIYRHTGDGQLKRIFRHAAQSIYETAGRIKIPDNEGAVGAAWLNEGYFTWSNTSNPNSNVSRNDLEKQLRPHGAKLPSCELTMPAREYLALAIRNPNGKKIAIVVVESTEPGKINENFIRSTIDAENHQISKQITIKSTLDEILNPDSN